MITVECLCGTPFVSTWGTGGEKLKRKIPLVVLTVILVFLLVAPLLQSPYNMDIKETNYQLDDSTILLSEDNPNIEIDNHNPSVVIIEYEEETRLSWVVWIFPDLDSGIYQIYDGDDYLEDEGEFLNGEYIDYPLEFLKVGTHSIIFRAYNNPPNPDLYDEVVTTVIVNPADSTPPTISNPMDITMFEGLDESVVWYADDEHPDDYTIWVDGADLWSDYWQPGEPIQWLLYNLPVGTHTASCWVRDSSHNEVRDDVIVTVLADSEPPFLSDAPDQSFLYGTNVIASWEADDVNPGTFTITEDGVPVVEDAPWTIGSAIEWPLSHLDLGTHQIVCTVYDEFGNSASDTVVASVYESHPDINVNSLNETEVTIVYGDGDILQWVVESATIPNGEYTIRSGHLESGQWRTIQTGQWYQGAEISLTPESLLYIGTNLIVFRAYDDPPNPALYAESITTVDLIADHPDIYSTCLNGNDVFTEVGELATLQWSIESDSIYDGIYQIEWFGVTDTYSWDLWSSDPFIASYELYTQTAETYTVTFRAYETGDGPYDQIITTVHVLPAPSYHIDVMSLNPSIVTLESGDESSLEWVVWSDISDSGHFEIEVDGSIQMADVWERFQPVYLSLSSLSEGTHSIQFTAWTDDWFWSEEVLTMVIVNAVPNYPPTISDAADMTMIEGSDFAAVWYAEDDNPGTYSIIEDGEVVVYGIPWASGGPIEFQLDHLDAGAHEIVCQVYDDNGLVASDVVRVAVGFVLGGPYPTASGNPLFTLSILTAAPEESSLAVDRAVWFGEDLRDIGIECVIYPLPHLYWFRSAFYGDEYGFETPSPTGAPEWAIVTRPPHFNHLMDEGVMWCGSFEGDSPTEVWGDTATPPGYGNDWNDILMKQFLLPPGPASLSYSIQYDTEQDYDFIHVQISVDGGNTWNTLTSLSGDSMGYETHTHDLTDYANQLVLIRFNFISDLGVSDEDGFDTDGACRIDWVEVTGYSRDEFTDDADDWSTKSQDVVAVEGFDIFFAGLNPEQGYRPGFEYILLDSYQDALNQGYNNPEYYDLVNNLISLDVDWNGNFPDPPDLSEEVLGILQRLQEIWIEEHPFWVLWCRDYWETGALNAGWAFALPNLSNEHLGNTVVRQAISLAMDRQGMIDSGLASAPRTWNVQTPIHPMNPGFDAISYAEYNVESAKALLLSAGYFEIISDSDPPVLLSHPDDVTMVESSNVYLFWSIDEDNPGVYSITDNGIFVVEDEPWNSGAIMWYLNHLDGGTHEITIYIYDLAGNSVSDTVIVNVTPALRWITDPLDVHVEYYHDYEDGWYHVLYFYSEYEVESVYATWFQSTDWYGIWRLDQPGDEGWISLGQTEMNPVGIYPQTVEIIDRMGNSLVADFSIIVEDTRSPEWLTELKDSVVNYGDFAFDFSVWDASGVFSYSINDTANFVLGPDSISTTHPLDIGEYGLLIEFYDPYGNVLAKAIRISVRDLTPPEWVEEPLSMYISEFGMAFSIPFKAKDYSDIGSVSVSENLVFEVVNLAFGTENDWYYVLGSVAGIDRPPVGEFTVDLFVEDIYENVLSTSITIIIQDTTAPFVFISNQEDFTYSQTTQIVGDIQIEDLSEISYINLQGDGLYLSDVNAFIRVTPYGQINTLECSLTTTADLEPGEYWFTFECQDIHGNTREETMNFRFFRQLELELTGEFDYLEKEDIPITLAVYLRCPETNELISGASVYIEIYNQALEILVDDVLVDLGDGWYRWVSSDTIANLKNFFTKGIYTVKAYVSTSETLFFWQASDLMEFHIDPPGESKSDTTIGLRLVSYTGFVIGIGAILVVFLTRYRGVKWSR